MKSKLFLAALSLSWLVLHPAQAAAAEVAQGKCIVYDTAAWRITLEEFGTEISQDYPYGKSTGTIYVFDSARARVGIPPEPGDILRIAYTLEGGVKRAIKVMNVSKQDLRKK